MARLHSFLSLYILLVSSAACMYRYSDAHDEARKVYIVYMGSLPNREDYSPSSHHANLLGQVLVDTTSSIEDHLVRSYTRSFNGFAAYLTEQEYQILAEHEDVVSIFPSINHQLHTTESWDFVGFPQNVKRNLKFESDVIIGLLDTGIWPESESFKDHGLGPPPKKWKGVCDGGANFTCNNKLIGARRYNKHIPVRDMIGHGTHTASTAAGMEVANASFFGVAQGTARGAVPSSRIVSYTVCHPLGCPDEYILAAFDDSVADGVDILSVSLGGTSAEPLQYSSIAIGSFHATKKGILTVQSAGNNGFTSATITSIAPWLFTVAASTTRRRIISKVRLGNGHYLVGNAVNSFDWKTGTIDLVYGKDAALATCNETSARNCADDCLDKDKVAGKIVACRRGDVLVYKEVNRAGGVGAILLTRKAYDAAFVTPYPVSFLSHKKFRSVEKYYSSTRKPRASIFPSRIIKNKVAPVVASFSSRGPNVMFPDILKPDITAPGVNILAAFPPVIPPSEIYIDKRSTGYNFLSGTSMACPHVSGAAAYVKSHHPHWSPSAIKSALMTTALRMNASNAHHGDAEFSYGAGFVDPVKATNPGLVYETTKKDYVILICSLDLNASTLAKIFGDNTTTCPKAVKSEPKDLNYPTLTAKVPKSKGFYIKFPRTVTNVGAANSTYKASVSYKKSECDVTVEPSILSFKDLKEKKAFTVTVKGGRVKDMISASLEWSDGIHVVRSPIVIHSKSYSDNI